MEDPRLRSVYLSDKVVLLGDAGVGKTTIFNRFCSGIPTGRVGPPLAEYRKEWKTKDGGETLRMTLFDTTGASMFGRPGHTPPNFFTGDKAILLVYSIDDLESFTSVPSWLSEATSRSHTVEPVIGIVGNKVDLQERSVSEEQVKEFATQNFIPEELVFEVSAKYGTNIDLMFDTVATKISSFSKKSNSKVKVSSTVKSDCCSK